MEISIDESIAGILHKYANPELIPFEKEAWANASDDMTSRRAAFERLEKLSRYIPELDERKELAEYREEKYGK